MALTKEQQDRVKACKALDATLAANEQRIGEKLKGGDFSETSAMGSIKSDRASLARLTKRFEQGFYQ